jgi:DNA-binding NarL/FixJ family response regulator
VEGPTRVVLCRLPRMLGDVVSELIGQRADVEVVAELTDEDDLLATVEASRADFVILGPATREAPAYVERLMRALARPRVLVVSADAQQGVLYELEPRRTTLAELSTDTLLAAIGGRAWTR